MNTTTIGKTKSGKDVYEAHSAEDYVGFSAQDHSDASVLHRERHSHNLNEASQAPVSGGVGRIIFLRSCAKAHLAIAEEHALFASMLATNSK